MIAFVGMLVAPAKEAGIEVPPEDDLEDFDKDKYAHWHVFVMMQIGASMPGPEAPWENAKVVAKIPKENIKTVTATQLYDLGFVVGCQAP